MELSLHANATTTPKTRAYIQRSRKSVAELATELGVSETTIYPWRAEALAEAASRAMTVRMRHTIVVLAKARTHMWTAPVAQELFGEIGSLASICPACWVRSNGS
ncbi:hypothetical protein NLM16_28990, partial [Bradyrhizobium brasilense]|nr:hypothetical protein [Bradyrhizobium brasilense]